MTDPLFAADALPELLPARMRKPLLHVVDNAMPQDWLGKFSLWLYEHRAQFVRGGDERGVERCNWELCELDRHCAALVAPFKARLVAEIQSALGPCSVPDFDLRFVEVTATMHHHGCHFIWHDDVPGYDGEVVISRRLSYTYYMHATPKMFSGGELEFLDGTAVEPRNNRLCLFHPAQQHRVREVECWSADFLHGRWALIGWVHGDPPLGWIERLPGVRGVPPSG